MSGVIAMTGASGFVGGHLVSLLQQQADHLRVLVRDPARLRKIDDPAQKIEIVRGDLSQAGQLSELCRGADTLVHCAGLIAARSAAEFFAVNRDGTARLVDIAAKAGIRRVVLLSSLAAREPSLSAYAASKRAGEDALASLASHMSWAILRPPAVYGPGDRATLPLVQQLSRNTAFIPGRPDARISLIHVRDLAMAVAHAAADDQLNGVVCELHDGTSGGYGWRDLRAAASQGEGTGERSRCLFLPRPLLKAAAGVMELAAPVFGRTPMLTSGKVAELYHRDWVCRHDLLDDMSDWRPRIRFAQGFAETHAWYRQAGWLS